MSHDLDDEAHCRKPNWHLNLSSRSGNTTPDDLLDIDYLLDSQDQRWSSSGTKNVDNIATKHRNNENYSYNIGSHIFYNSNYATTGYNTDSTEVNSNQNITCTAIRRTGNFKVDNIHPITGTSLGLSEQLMMGSGNNSSGVCSYFSNYLDNRSKINDRKVTFVKVGYNNHITADDTDSIGLARFHDLSCPSSDTRTAQGSNSSFDKKNLLNDLSKVSNPLLNQISSYSDLTNFSYLTTNQVIVDSHALEYIPSWSSQTFCVNNYDKISPNVNFSTTNDVCSTTAYSVSSNYNTAEWFPADFSNQTTDKSIAHFGNSTGIYGQDDTQFSGLVRPTCANVEQDYQRGVISCDISSKNSQKNLHNANLNADNDCRSNDDSNAEEVLASEQSDYKVGCLQAENKLATKTRLKSFIIKRLQEHGKEEIVVETDINGSALMHVC